MFLPQINTIFFTTNYTNVFLPQIAQIDTDIFFLYLFVSIRVIRGFFYLSESVQSVAYL